MNFSPTFQFIEMHLYDTLPIGRSQKCLSTIVIKNALKSSSLFLSVYSPDMPSRLPVQDIFAGLVTSIGTAIRYWFHYTLVAFAWLGVVPLTACK